MPLMIATVILAKMRLSAWTMFLPTVAIAGLVMKVVIVKLVRGLYLLFHVIVGNGSTGLQVVNIYAFAVGQVTRSLCPIYSRSK